MRRFMVPIIILSIAAVPAALAAQTPETQRRPAFTGAGMGGNIGERIIAQREALGLTLDQVTQIRRIQAQLEEQNRPLVEQVRSQLQAQRQQITAEQREQMREQLRERMKQNRDGMGERRPGRGPFAGARAELPEETRAAMQQVRNNVQQAAQQIRSTLTAAQLAKLRERRPARSAPPGEAAAGRRGGARAPGR